MNHLLARAHGSSALGEDDAQLFRELGNAFCHLLHAGYVTLTTFGD